MNLSKYLSIIFLSILLCSCVEALNTVNTAVRIFDNADALTHGYYSYNMVKDIKSAEPLFDGYQHVHIQTLIIPRDDTTAIKVSEAFKKNFEYVINEQLKVSELPVNYCNETNCTAKSISVQFKENGYSANLAQKIFMGDTIRGKLYFIDNQKQSVLREESIESAEDYKTIFGIISASVGSKIIKTVQMKSPEKTEILVDKMNAIPLIKKEYEDVLENS